VRRPLEELLPAVDLSRDDLPWRASREAHGGDFGVWQDGLRFDPPLEFFVQTFNGLPRAEQSPLARGEAHESVLSVRRFIQAVKALMPPIFSRAGNKHAVLRVYFPIGAEPSKEN
jgi:hypothetical protein